MEGKKGLIIDTLQLLFCVYIWFHYSLKDAALFYILFWVLNRLNILMKLFVGYALVSRLVFLAMLKHTKNDDFMEISKSFRKADEENLQNSLVKTYDDEMKLMANFVGVHIEKTENPFGKSTVQNIVDKIFNFK